MKRTLLLIGAFLLTLTSCVENGNANDPFAAEAEARSTKLDSTSPYSDKQYRTYTLEGCEYIVANYGSSTWGSHKGNCKNPIHSAK